MVARPCEFESHPAHNMETSSLEGVFFLSYFYHQTSLNILVEGETLCYEVVWHNVCNDIIEFKYDDYEESMEIFRHANPYSYGQCHNYVSCA